MNKHNLKKSDLFKIENEFAVIIDPQNNYNMIGLFNEYNFTLVLDKLTRKNINFEKTLLYDTDWTETFLKDGKF